MTLRVAIVGCGLVGRKRAAALGDSRLVAVADTDAARAKALAASFRGCAAVTKWRRAVERDDVDLVIVCTTHDGLTPVALGAVEAGKHVLVEKPAARNAEELAPLVSAAAAAKVAVKVGFNHRFHPALRKAREIFGSGGLGPLLYVRGRYGHGGRPGYEREWRADPAVAGGGELVDQGLHLIDLARWFAGDFAEATGHVATFFWDMPVEDNGFALLRTARGQVAWLHASWTEWKNLFCFEVFGRDGKLQVDGLGGSYGVERLTHHRRGPRMGPPETEAWEFPGEDTSWRDELAHFVACIREGREPDGSLHDARAALEIVGRIYEQSRRPS